ncbi:MAG: TlpA disulfide reductase family protein [Ferruginibacter sp.]
MNKRSYYIAAVVLLLTASYFIVKKLKRTHVPQINLSGITLKDLNGRIVNLNEFAGKPLVINFWGSWCGPCRQEFPGFENIKTKYGSQINFLMVSDEPVDKIIKFKEENTYTFFYAQSQTPFHDLGIRSVPFTYFYDARGTLIVKKKDPLNEEELNGLIAEMVR